MSKISLIKHILFASSLFASGLSSAQTSLKFRSNGTSTPTATGPTIANRVITFNTGNSTTAYSPATNATFSLSNQQYNTVEPYAANNMYGVVFGSNGNTSGNTVANTRIYNALNYFGLAANGNFSTNGVTPAIDVTNDYAVELAVFADALINTNGTNKVAMRTKNIQFADLTVTFNRPVNNPVLHFENMGGWWNTTNNGYTGYSAWFRLLTTGVTASRLSGNTPFVVVNGTDIKNSVAASSNGLINTNNNIAQGSVVMNGTGITTLTFRVFLDGDNNNGLNWSTTNSVQTDAVTVSVSLAGFNVGGTVYNDANGMTDNTVNGTGSNAGGLYAVLVDANNNVFASVPVNADGTYNFTNVVASNYSIALSTTQPAAGSAFSGASLPDGWVATGEKLGSGTGSDGTADGVLTGVSITNANITTAFGIERPPTTDNVTAEISTPTNGTIPQGTITTPPSGNDPEDGALGSGNTVVVTELPTNGTLLYNGNAVTAGQSIDNFDPKLLSFTDLQGGTTSTSFKYSLVDAAGKQSATPGTFTTSWDTPLPVTFGPITAQISSGELVVNWSTVMEKNNDHFIIELSKDGKNFTSIGTVQSKAANGNSSEELRYSFSKGIDSATAIAGILSAMMIGICLLAFNRKNRLLLAVIVLLGSGIIATSCNKRNADTIEPNQKLFVRIVQVNKDGSQQVSKVIQVNSKDE